MKRESKTDEKFVWWFTSEVDVIKQQILILSLCGL